MLTMPRQSIIAGQPLGMYANLSRPAGASPRHHAPHRTASETQDHHSHISAYAAHSSPRPASAASLSAVSFARRCLVLASHTV